MLGLITSGGYGYNNDNGNVDDEISLSDFSPTMHVQPQQQSFCLFTDNACTTATTVTVTLEVVEAEAALLC